MQRCKDVGAGSSSPKLQSPYSHPLSSFFFFVLLLFFLIQDLMIQKEEPSSNIQGKLPEGSLGHVDSSLVKDASADVISDQKTVACKGTDIPVKNCLKPEAGNTNDGGTPTDEVLKCLDQGQGEQEEKSSELGIGEPHLPSKSGNESDESDIVEHDVSSIFSFNF